MILQTFCLRNLSLNDYLVVYLWQSGREFSALLSTQLSCLHHVVDQNSHLHYAMCFAVQLSLQTTVLSQLESVERKASSIIFFNEPLTNLDELHWPFTFPYDALQPVSQSAAPTYLLALESDKR